MLWVKKVQEDKELYDELLLLHGKVYDAYQNKKEQNPAWSEEDDLYLLVCKNALAKYQTTDKWDANIISRWLENKLKSLRPQPQWKPSEEQIQALEYQVHSTYKGSWQYRASKELLEQLKKL